MAGSMVRWEVESQLHHANAEAGEPFDPGHLALPVLSQKMQDTNLGELRPFEAL